MLRRRSPLRGILVLVGLAAAAAGGMYVWRRTHLPVFFDNALTVPVTITVDGEAFPLAADSRVERALAAGTHTIRVTGPRGEIERYTAKIAPPDLDETFLGPGFYIYNVAETRVYQRESIGYTYKKDESAARYHRDVIGLQRFFHQDEVDFLFREPPKRIQGDGTDSVERKTAFNVDPGGLTSFGASRVDQDDLVTAEKALRKGLTLAPCDIDGRLSLVLLLELQKRQEEMLQVARGWTACPGIDPHRQYQEALRRAGRSAEVLAEYRARLDAHPEIGANHYLYARLLTDPEQQLAEYREAVRLEPGLARAHAGIGYVLLEREQHAEALEAFGRALAVPAHPADLHLAYAMAAVGAGSPGPADQVLQRTGAGPEDVWEARWLLALADGRFDDAQDLLNAHEDRDPDDTDVWKHRILLLRLAGRRELLDKELSRAAHREELAEDLATVHFDMALEEGRFRDAAAVVDREMAEDRAGANRVDRVYAAAALLLAGDRKAADERLGKLAAELAGEKDWSSRNTQAAGVLTTILDHPISAAEAIRRAAQVDFTVIPHAYFMLGVRAAAAGDAQAAHGFFARSRKTALDLELPYLAAQALAK
jgi:tetratricopeptide (TPR) repeat protein